MARILGIPHFLTTASAEEEKADTANIRRIKRSMTAEQKEYIVAANQAKLTGAMESDSEDPGLFVRIEQIKAVQRMQGQYDGRIIRRTTSSKDYDGHVVIDIPPYRLIPGLLKLTDREMANIQDIAEKAKDS